MYASICFETEFFSLLKSNREEKWWALWVLEGLQRFLLLLLLLSTACLRCCCWCCCLRFPFDSTETQCVLCVLCTNKKERNRGKTTFAWGLHRFVGLLVRGFTNWVRRWVRGWSLASCGLWFDLLFVFVFVFLLFLWLSCIFFRGRRGGRRRDESEAFGIVNLICIFQKYWWIRKWLKISVLLFKYSKLLFKILYEMPLKLNFLGNFHWNRVCFKIGVIWKKKNSKIHRLVLSIFS